MLSKIHDTLLGHYDAAERPIDQWWPISGLFKPSEWEVCIGTILTQNTNWKNVEKAIENMKKERLFSPEDLVKIKKKRLEEIINPAGFFSQKSERLMDLANFVIGFRGDFFRSVTREQLLAIKGIGPETADSILLYACNKPFFVIDAYTRRVFSRLGYCNESVDYERLRNFFEQDLPRDVNVYKRFHALIVELAKDTCRKFPVCEKCALVRSCEFGRNNMKKRKIP